MIWFRLITWTFSDHRWMIHGVINCSIHFFMYTYYLLSSYEHLKKYTDRVKMPITVVQIVQLIFICIHSTFHTFAKCGSKLFVTQALNTLLLTVLFINFFIQTYIKKKHKKKINWTGFWKSIKVGNGIQVIISLLWQKKRWIKYYKNREDFKVKLKWLMEYCF